ncbi:MAG: DM13 domain-containing protein [Tepidiformaceae bacterium]
MQKLNSLLLHIPWYVTALVVAVGVVAGAGATRYFAGPLFYETCENERNLLTGELEASNCGEGAKVAQRQDETPQNGAAPGGRAPDGTPPVPSTPATPTIPTTSPTHAGPGVVAAGSFVDGEPGHQGSGEAELQRLADGRLNVFLSNFSVTNGPDLVVVLSEDPGGSRASVSGGLTLDALKANNGNQNYEIPAGTDTSRFKSVIIYCKSFPTVFAYATLEVQ